MDILIVVDMQRDFIDGALGTEEAAAIVPKVVARIKEFTGKIIYTRDTHEENYLDTQEGKNLPVSHCIRGSEGWELHPQIAALEIETVFDKSAFGSTTLGYELQKLAKKQEAARDPIQSITLIGLCTDICVIVNAMLLKAFLPEIPLIVDASCCAGVTPTSHKNALEAMKACQIKILE